MVSAEKEGGRKEGRIAAQTELGLDPTAAADDIDAVVYHAKYAADCLLAG